MTPNDLIDAAYHDLLFDVLPQCTQPIYVPLRLLSAFFLSLRNRPNLATGRIFESAARSFSLLYEESAGSQKAEQWTDVWGHMIAYLASARPILSRTDDGGPWELVHFVCDGLREALPVSHDAVKVRSGRCAILTLLQIAQSLFGTLPAFAIVLETHTPMKERLRSTFASLLLPPAMLQRTNPLQSILDALGYAVDPSIELHLLPWLLQSMITYTTRARFDLFNQPSSSKLPYDVFVADKVRDTVRSTMSAIIDRLNLVETNASAAVVPVIWASRYALWGVILSWGGYLERDSSWIDLVEAETKRAQTSMETHCSDPHNCQEVARSILQVMTVLETLDHANARIGPFVISWCITVRSSSRYVVVLLILLIRLLSVRMTRREHYCPQYSAIISSPTP